MIPVSVAPLAESASAEKMNMPSANSEDSAAALEGASPRLTHLLRRPADDLPDDVLIDLARRSDERAFEALMRRYNRRLFRATRSVLRDRRAAEDAVQEAYIRAFMNLDRYAPTGSFGAWLTRIAYNEALMIRRKTHGDTVSLDDIDEATLHRGQESLGRVASSVDPIEAAHARRLLEQAVDALPEAFRAVFVLRVVEQLSVSETAACLALKEATVKTRLHRAHRRLRLDLTRRLQSEQLQLFDFAGASCDRIVAGVLSTMRSLVRSRQ